MMLIVPEFIYRICLLGSIAVAFVSVIMSIKGIFKKNRSRYFIKWCIILIVALVVFSLTTTGVIVANTMFGG